MNPFLLPYNTPFDTPPFEKIKTVHFAEAIEEGIKDGKEQLKNILENKAMPDFDNTIVALENVGELLEKVTTVFFNLNSAETSQEIQEIAQEISPKLSAYSNDILLNDALFEKVKFVFEKTDQSTLSTEQRMLLNKAYKSFTRNGALLNAKDKERLRSIDETLGKISLKFGENVLAATNAYQLWVEDVKDLAGIPESIINSYHAAATMNGREDAFLITLDYPSYMPFMTYADNRELREKLSKAFGSRAYKDKAFDNQINIKTIVRLRQERAQLLGYESHAHFVLEERMAKDPETVETFLKDLQEKAYPVAVKEKEELDAFAQSLGLEKVERFDAAYIGEKLKMDKYAIDEEVLKPYFELNNVLDGVFQVAKKLYGISFSEIFNIQKYHDEVRTFEVKSKDGEHVSIFFTDFHPRPSKRPGAWMTSYRGISKTENGEEKRPHVSIVCNFTKPTKETPSLLTFQEVRTLFHEFGHALHGMLGKGTYKSLTGTNVYWDFVELPSQIMENWCLEKEVLHLFARHYQTGELFPEEYIERLKKAAAFQEGLMTLRQLSFGTLDMFWHNNPPEKIEDIGTTEKEIMEAFQLYPSIEGSCMSTAFSHIFQGGYSAGYYSYKWAEVLDADAYEFFKERGVFNAEVALRFKENILEKGGTEHPMELYEKFRGKKPDPKALLRRAGLI